MTGPEPGPRRRTPARVHRVGPEVSHLVLPRWMHGQITVPIPTTDLQAGIGLTRGELPGTEVTVIADLTATTEDVVRPSEPQLPGQRRLSAVCAEFGSLVLRMPAGRTLGVVPAAQPFAHGQGTTLIETMRITLRRRHHVQSAAARAADWRPVRRV